MVNLFAPPNYAELEKDSEYMEGLLKHAVGLALKNFNLDQIMSMTNYSGTSEELLKLIDEALVNELELYKTIYRTRNIISLNKDLMKIDETLEDCRYNLIPGLLGVKLKINQEMTRLLDEVSGIVKPGLTINYRIEGVDLDAV